MDFSGTNSERPIILIGGLNGRGKTTILEAILLALYGKLSLAVVMSKLSYTDYLRKHINGNNKFNKSYVELKIELFHNQPIITIRREWSDDIKSITDKITIYQNSKLDEYMADNWDLLIESVLPAGISKFFFFDGEKITELVKDQTDHELKDSIRTLLGIDTIDRLISDCNKLITKQCKNENHGSMNVSLIELENYLADKEEKSYNIIEDIKKLDLKLSELQSISDDYKYKIITRGGHAFYQRRNLEEKKSTLNNSIDIIDQKIKELVSGLLPLSLVMPLLKDINTGIEIEESKKMAHIILKEMIKVQEKLTNILEDISINNEYKERILDVFSSCKTNYTENIELNYNISPTLFNQLKYVCETGIESSIEKMGILLEEKENLIEEINNLNSYIQDQNDELEVGYIQNLLKKIDSHIIDCKTEKRVLESKLSQLKHDILIEEKNIRMNKQMMLESKKGRVREARIVKYLNYTIHVMNDYKFRLQEAKVSTLIKAVNERFVSIVGKKDLINKIDIDAKTLDITISDVNNQRFSKERLSAGERQMFAIAMLWGLASCLEFQLPVIIDTPLSRLDSIHRENFIRKYLPNAGEQVIVLSTDEEINNAYATMLSPYISKKFTLYYDNTSRSTIIFDGYFHK